MCDAIDLERVVLRFDFEESVGYWICLTSQAMRRALTTRLAEEGITLRQWEVLACLACSPDVSQAELAERMGIEPPTLAGVLRRMERDGWLNRRSCDDDRRRNRLEATEKAEEVWQRCVRACQDVRQQAIKGFTAPELSILKKLCAEIRENLAVPDEPCVLRGKSASQPVEAAPQLAASAPNDG
jgi:MarR family transcriptional regulator for hemolysin